MMQRIISLCSAFILMCSAFAHADLLSDRISAKSLSLSENQAVKLASVYMIGSEHKVGFVSFNQEVTADPEEDTGCQFTNLSLPTNCAEPQNSCTKNNVTYYSSSCKTCSPGYEVENGICKVNPCTGYREEQDVAGCNHYDTCQRGLQTVYKCDSCRQGYELAEDGSCNTITCDENEFPYRRPTSAGNKWRPTICKTVSDPCYSGDDVYYGCTECNPGYMHSGGLCAETVCGTGFEDSCPAHGTCDTCQSGETTKYKLTGCDPTYELNAAGTGCVRKKAVAVEVTVSNNDEYAVAVTGPFEIDWGDGTIETGTGTTTLDANGVPSNYDYHRHTYTTAGTYAVYVSGTPTYVKMLEDDDEDYEKLTRLLDISLPSVISFYSAFNDDENGVSPEDMQGDLTNMTFPSGLVNGQRMFTFCQGLTGNIPELPNGLTTGDIMFNGCTGLHGQCPTKPDSLTTTTNMYAITNVCCDYGDAPSTCAPEIPDHAVAFTVTTTAASQGITIKTTGAAHINWGDGNTEDVTGDATATVHSYTNSGSYNVYVTGTPTAFAVTAGQTYLTELLDISLPSITSYENAFKSCENMTGDLTNMTFPSGLTNGSNMFYDCYELTGNIPELPDGLSNGLNMFFYCKKLTGNVQTLPSGLTIGRGMFAGCTGLTGSIPTLPSGLTDGWRMFFGCIGLTGNVPALPDRLTEGRGMFNGCNGLTGQCPNKPDSLTAFNLMYVGTNVCCDYGDAPSQCVPPCTYVNANPLANCAEEDSCVIDDTTYYSGTCTSCANRTVLYEGKCVPTCKGELSSDENGIKCCVTLNSQTTCLYVWCENGTDPTTPANLGMCGETTCPTGYTASDTICCKTVSNEKGTAECCGSSINATLNNRLTCTYTSCNDGYTLSNIIPVSQDGNYWTNNCAGGSTPITPGGNLDLGNTCESSGYSITEPIEHCASQSTCTFLTTTYYKCSACSGIYELHNGICDYDQSTCTDPDTHDASGPGCGYCSIRKYTSHDKCSKYAVCHEKWQEGYNYYCTACDSGYNLVDGQCVKYTGNTECLNKKYTSLSTIHCTAGNGSTHETCYEMTGDGSGSWAIKKTWYYCTYCNSYIDQNWYTVLGDGQCYIENGGL